MLLAADAERHLVSMLVRLAPGASYPTHTHAGVEELHLLHGELWIEDRKLACWSTRTGRVPISPKSCVRN
jgi:anti-sigma factor ChrR (cupin superfamily)